MFHRISSNELGTHQSSSRWPILNCIASIDIVLFSQMMSDQLWAECNNLEISACDRTSTHLHTSSSSALFLRELEGCACLRLQWRGWRQDNETSILKYFWSDSQMTWNLSLRWNKTLASLIAFSCPAHLELNSHFLLLPVQIGDDCADSHITSTSQDKMGLPPPDFPSVWVRVKLFYLISFQCYLNE